MIVSHDPESARVADRIVRISDGRVSEEWARDADESDTIVVGRGGWLRLPEELLLRAGIATKAVARFEDGAVVVAPGRRRAAGRRARAGAGAEASGRRPAPVVVSAARLAKSYGSTAVLDRPRPLVHRRPPARRHRPVRLGQDDAAAPARGARATRRRHDPRRGPRPDGARPHRRARRSAVSTSRYVGQQAGLVPHLSALENVELALALRGRDEGSRLAALAALDSVGLGERATQRVSRLSHGERARVAIARAVAAGPSLLLADEPTSRLDGANAIAVAILLARLARETGAAVVCSTHDPLVIEQADSAISLS